MAKVVLNEKINQSIKLRLEERKKERKDTNSQYIYGLIGDYHTIY